MCLRRTLVIAGTALALLACGGSADQGGQETPAIVASATGEGAPVPSATIVASPFAPVDAIAFPTNPLGDGLEASNGGDLILDAGCFWLLPPEEERLLIVWPLGYSWSVDAGVAQVHDESGQVVARAGDTIEIGGHETGSISPIPACPGRVWEATGPVKVLD